MTDTFERNQLDGKDRGQLSEIAAALGVKAVSRMRKAELVDAIVSATSGAADAKANGSETARPRKIRSTTSGGDDLASLADEQNALADSTEPADDMALIRRRPSAAPGNGRATSAPSAGTATFSADATTTTESPASTSSSPSFGARPDGPSASSSDSAPEASYSESGTSTDTSQQPARDDDGQGNRRRRRRRGRDRDRPGGAPSGGSVTGVSNERSERSESSREDFTGDLIDLEGLLDLREEGYGFLRTSGYLAGRNDAYVSASQVRRFGLRKGDYVKGAIRPPASTEKYPALVRVDLINGMTPEEARSPRALRRPHPAVPRFEVAPRARQRSVARSPAGSSTSSHRSGRANAV